MSEEEEGGSSEARAVDAHDRAVEIPVASESFRRVLSAALQLPLRGAALLEWIGRFDVWTGDLGSMRGDKPAPPPEPPLLARMPASAGSLVDVLAARKAFLSLDEDCRTALRALAIDGITHSGDEIAARRVRSCVDRLQLRMTAARRELALIELEGGGESAERAAMELLHE